MEQPTRIFTSRINALAEVCSVLAGNLSTAAQQLSDSGRLVPADVFERARDLNSAISKLCGELHQYAVGLEIPNLPAEPQSLADARAMLEHVIVFEGGIERARTTALAALDLVLALVHIDQPSFGPLTDCQARAVGLRNEILTVELPELHSAVRDLARGQHSFNTVVTLAANASTLDDDTSDALFSQVQEAFGQQLALALARGRITTSAGALAPTAPNTLKQPDVFTPPEKLAEQDNLIKPDLVADTPLVSVAPKEQADTAVPDEHSILESHLTVLAPTDLPATMPEDTAPAIVVKPPVAKELATPKEQGAELTSSDAGGASNDTTEHTKLEPVEDLPSIRAPATLGLNPLIAPAAPQSPIARIAPATTRRRASIIATTSGTDNRATNTAWIAELIADVNKPELTPSTDTLASPDLPDLIEHVHAQLSTWLKDWTHLPHAYLLGRWLAGVGENALISTLPPLNLFEIAICAFHPQIDTEQCPSFSPLYTTLSVTPPTVQQVSAWFLSAALVLVRGEKSVRELLEFIEWMERPEWQPWLRFGQVLLTYVHDSGASVMEIMRMLDEATETIDPKTERNQARDLLNAITAPGYFDFKKGQRLSLILNRELAWLRQDLQKSKPNPETLEWFEKLRLERQLDRWADDAEPRTVSLDGRRRQGILRDLQALREHVQRWGAASDTQHNTSTRRAALRALKELNHNVHQEQDIWLQTWAQTDYPALTAWCELLLQRITPMLKRAEGDNDREVTP